MKRFFTLEYWEDDGKTWKKSNIIDLGKYGGYGDHGGGCEAAIVELTDGRIWMLLRTPRGRFSEAFSADQGLTWTDIRPAKIEASSSPGVLQRLASGRIMLAWNRFAPGRPKRIGRREQLSVAFSEDDGKTWSDPVVVAQNRTPEGEKPQYYRVSYPSVFEYEPGVVWITASQGGARLILREQDFTGGSAD